jgi:N4-(beta-N-acetylglucosaminyl)-L-asparaginase
MSIDRLKRRDFVKGTTLAGLSAPFVIRGQARASQAARPVIVASANLSRPPDGSRFEGGIACVNRAMEVLKSGADTLDAVIAGVNIVEDDPRDNSVGYGGLPNEDGDVELDSSVMHGPSRRAGAVASLRYIKNPSKVAKLVLERTNHILLVGEGALRFAVAHGFKKEELLTEDSRKLWLKWREEMSDNDFWGPSPKHAKPNPRSSVSMNNLPPEEIAFNEWAAEVIRRRPTGTINCLALNAAGDISGVTTTSGMAFKIPGRVGDSPLIGCGLYVDNEIGAAGSTGHGEECIFINGSHTVVENMRRGMSPTDAALDAIKRVSARYNNNKDELIKIGLNFYAVNKRGEYGGATLWKGGRFVVHDGKEAKTLDSVYLYDKP